MDNQTNEQALRQEAIRRRLEGERRCEICDDLQRSLRGFSKWWAAYQQNPHLNFADRSRTPQHSPTQLPEQVEEAIINVRLTLETADCGLIGRQAIQQELARLQVKPFPGLTTIQRVLVEHGLTHARGVATDSAYYPELIAWTPKAIHATDIITRPLSGGAVVQHFPPCDPDAHAVHRSPSADKSRRTACAHWLAPWAPVGLPAVQQLDHENAFSAGHPQPRLLGRGLR